MSKVPIPVSGALSRRKPFSDLQVAPIVVATNLFGDLPGGTLNGLAILWRFRAPGYSLTRAAVDPGATKDRSVDYDKQQERKAPQKRGHHHPKCPGGGKQDQPKHAA